MSYAVGGANAGPVNVTCFLRRGGYLRAMDNVSYLPSPLAPEPPPDLRPRWRRCVAPVLFGALWIAVMVPIALGYGGYVLLAAVIIWAVFAAYDVTRRLLARLRQP